MRTVPGAPLAIALLTALLGCGGSTAAPQETAPADTPGDGYSIHEWGLISFGVGEERGMATAGPGHFPPSLPEVGAGGGTGASYKPVIYAHLEPGAEAVTFRARVRIPAGTILEHWPAGSVRDVALAQVLEWETVTARRGACTGLEYPEVGSPRCSSVADGFCETAELRLYETRDSACLSIGGQGFNNLFYRAGFPSGGPILVSLGEDGAVRVSHEGERPLPGPLMRIRRGTTSDLSRVSIVDAPAPGEAVEIARSAIPISGSAAARSAILESIETTLVSLGMTEAERAAFTLAWADDLIGPATAEAAEAPVQRPTRGVPALTHADDALLYWMPVEDIDAFMELELDPAPTEIRRAFLVRVHLAPVPWPRAQWGYGESGFGGRTLRVPRVRAGPARIATAAISGDVVRRVVRRHINEIRFCYEQRLLIDEELAGAVTIRAELGPDGLVSETEVVSSTVSDPEVGVCMARAFGRWAFPAFEGDAVTIDLPFTLSSTS